MVVWRLDRLGRSLPHLIEIIADLEERRVGFKSVQESIDTATPGGRCSTCLVRLPRLSSSWSGSERWQGWLRPGHAAAPEVVRR